MTIGDLHRKHMIAEMVRSIIAALAELQNKRIPTHQLGELQNIDEQIWGVVDACDEEDET